MGIIIANILNKINCIVSSKINPVTVASPDGTRHTHHQKTFSPSFQNKTTKIKIEQ